MNERIDHVNEAMDLFNSEFGTRPNYLPYETADVQHLLNMLGAHVHATLALVEQQRIANLIQLMHIPVGDLNESIRSALHAAFHDDRDWEAELREGVGLT